jgi:2,4-dienoyl-CoA reductase-like NADH-dependent reductase (Old Yellow Enzyme family)
MTAPFVGVCEISCGILMVIGIITSATQAETILESGQASVIVIARQFLRDPYWPLHAAAELKKEIGWPCQYHLASPTPDISCKES